MFKAKESTLMDRVRVIQKSDRSNRECANCGELGPIYICMDFLTFVCTECAGVHRELTHKVKSISMTKWSVHEVEELESLGGNLRDAQKYLGFYDSIAFPRPKCTSPDSLRSFVRAKYLEKRWASPSANLSGRASPQASVSTGVDLLTTAAHINCEYVARSNTSNHGESPDTTGIELRLKSAEDSLMILIQEISLKDPTRASMLVDALVERIRGRYFQPSSREFNSIEPVEVEILHRGEVSPKLIHGSQNRKDPFLELPMNNVSPSISGNQKSIITPLTTATSMRSDPFIDLI
jgi:hypothetical protein